MNYVTFSKVLLCDMCTGLYMAFGIVVKVPWIVECISEAQINIYNGNTVLTVLGKVAFFDCNSFRFVSPAN